MNALDSRIIGQGDCFAHRFSTEGEFRYELSPLPGPLPVDARDSSSFTVTVTRRGEGSARSHYVTVSQGRDGITARPGHVTAGVGDLVIWSGDRSLNLGFRVRGQTADTVVDSGSLDSESIFTHAFGLAGTYRWRDANGSPLSGEVVVSNPDTNDGSEAWHRRLREGTLVHVKGRHADPERVEVVVGQTVVWAVEDSTGITITDSTLLAKT